MTARAERRPIASRAWSATKRLGENRLTVVGLAIIVFFGLMALSHPILMATVWESGVYDPLTGYDFEVFHPSGPSAAHPLGTDSIGRDVLSQLLVATRSTWVLAVVAALTTAVVSTAVGAVSAFYRGWPDTVLQHVADAVLLLPAPIFLLVIGSGTLSQEIGPVMFGLIYGVITGAGAGAIVLRSQALQIMARPFVAAARVAGGRGRWIIFRHLLPHLYPLAFLFMMLAVVGAVVADGFASFLGQTAQKVTWGTMVYYGVTFRDLLTHEVAWNALVPPALALSLFAAAFYLVSVGFREIADPRYQAARRTFTDQA